VEKVWDTRGVACFDKAPPNNTMHQSRTQEVLARSHAPCGLVMVGVIHIRQAVER
jgi:hypothetical protein